MKRTILVMLLLLPLFINAQPVFAPPGSEWYHSQHYGAFHCYYSGDTVLDNTPCRKVIRTALTRDPEYSQGFHVYDQSTIYVYDNADTVFIYNRYFHRFTPLYVFNVNDGDTIHLPVIPLDIGDLTFAYPDSTFKIVVDSVRNVLYDTATLKTVYVHPLGDPDSVYVYDYGQGYAERIGGLSTGFIPNGTPAVIILSDNVQPATGIKCYNDPSMSIKLVADICGIPPVSVNDVPKARAISLSPNPVSGNLIVTAPYSVNNIEICNITGQKIYSHHFSGTKLEINMSALPAGIYFARINGTEIKKIIKE